MFYAITRINYQFKRSELKNVEKLVKHLHFNPYSLITMDWKCAVLYNP